MCLTSITGTSDYSCKLRRRDLPPLLSPPSPLPSLLPGTTQVLEYWHICICIGRLLPIISLGEYILLVGVAWGGSGRPRPGGEGQERARPRAEAPACSQRGGWGVAADGGFSSGFLSGFLPSWNLPGTRSITGLPARAGRPRPQSQPNRLNFGAPGSGGPLPDSY